ncbi:hypothetical protein ACH5RR_022581 [Cinchona calisaya]|uniref:BZIP domain-containing protein n=1 Tax=Cinchona calisaya TaxID=153742 RepID=A0ABD2Z9U3_9GENT
MANSKGTDSMRNMMYIRNSLLPPKSPFPSIAQPYVDYVPSSANGQKGTMRPQEGSSHHQRTSSESLIIEEQPSWLDDLLNEPETPVRKGGHRRSSSDSFAYIDAASVGSIDYADLDGSRYNNMMPVPSWGSQDFDHYRDAQLASFVADSNFFGKHINRAWVASSNSVTHLRGFPPSSSILQSSGPSRSQQEAGVVPTTASEKQNIGDYGLQDSKGSCDKRDSSHGNPTTSETDTKRAKQQFAQRSRVRKLQYIAELEKNVQKLQAEGSEVSAEVEFLNQQHLILSMENKALKQRLESLAQEQLIKYVEHEVIEREVGRLQALYQQQQQPQQQQPPSHRRNNSRDLDLQFANLSLKQKDNSTGSDRAPGQLNL